MARVKFNLFYDLIHNAARQRFCLHTPHAQLSIVLAPSLRGGMVLDEGHLAFKRPGTVFCPAEGERVLGQRLNCSVNADELLDCADRE